MAIGEDLGKLVVFTDVTKESILEKTLDDKRTTLGVITIDSYDDIMQGLDEMDKVNTVAGIDREIVSWVSSYEGVVNKIEKDKYIYIIEKEDDSSFFINFCFILIDNLSYSLFFILLCNRQVV